MTRRFWQLLSLALLLLAVFSHVEARAKPDAPQKSPSNEQADPSQTPYEGKHDVPLSQDGQRPAGADAVQEATNILRKLRPTTGRLAKLTKPKGVLGTSLYYAKELFTLLFMNAPSQVDLLTTIDDKPAKLSPPLAKAVGLLERAAYDHENPGAIFLLAEMNFHGNFTHPRNYTRAFQHYYDLANLHGNTTAQYMLGFMYATGIGGVVDQDQAKALLYHTFAAEGGHIKSQMTVAYRHHAGIGTPRDCDKAVQYYKQVADKAVTYYKSGPPGGHVLVKNAYRLADEDGGVYGEGASVSSSGANAKQGGPTSDAYADLDDVMEYLDFQARKGDIRAKFNMAKLYYDGTRGLPRDMRTAKEHFMQIARMYWPSQGQSKSDLPSAVERLAPRAAGYLGRMFLRGEGTEQSYAKAKIWFKRGIESGDALSQYSMGLMYLHGLGVPQDVEKAASYFGPAADNDLAVAQTHLGVLFLDQGDVGTARSYFELAARNGHIEAYYYLAELAEKGLGRDRSCGVAAVYYKIAAEKAEVIHTSFIEANEAFESGDLETAIVDYMMAAEQGYENAQANVAFLLDQTQPLYSLQSLLPWLRKYTVQMGDAALALIYWTRSAKQQNLDSLVKMGDYYLSGLGISTQQSAEGMLTVQGRSNPENAAACYNAAAETMQSAQALWNLGWMHENGIGMQQDFHLAKRFYDQASETNVEAYAPVKLALIRLRIRSWWNDISGGDIKGIHDEPVEKKKRTLSEWLTAFLEADAEYYAQQQQVDPNHPDGGGANADVYEPDDWDVSATYHNDGLPPGAGTGPDGDNLWPDDIDDGVIESLLIVALAAVLAFLVWWRQMRVMEQRRRREEEERRQGLGMIGGGAGVAVQGEAEANAGGVGAVGGEAAAAADRGVFPDPDDPALADWAVGGIGH